MSAAIQISVTGGKDAAKEIANVGKASKDAGKATEETAEKLRKQREKDSKDTKSALKEVSGGIGDFISNATSGWAGAIRIAADVANFALGVGEKLTAGASIYQEVDFGKATQQQRGLEEAATRLSFRTGESMKGILGTTRGVSEALGENQEAVLHVASSYIALSQSTNGAKGAVEAIGEVADQSGRKMEEVVPHAAAIGRAFGTTGEQLRSSFAAIERISSEAGNTGGLLAFENTIASLGPQIERMGIQTDESRNKIIAFAAALGKGLNPAQATQVASQGLNGLNGKAFQISRTLGHDILDEHGNVKDVTQTYKELQAFVFKHRGGKGSKRALWALRGYLGDQLGSQVFHTNFDEVEKQAKAASQPKPPPPKKSFAQTQPGLRNQFDAKLGNKILETGQRNLYIKDEAQSKVTDFGGVVNKILAFDNIPGFIARFEKLAEIGANTEGGLDRLEKANPELAKQEKEKIKQQPKGKTYTDKDGTVWTEALYYDDFPGTESNSSSTPIVPPTADEQKKINQAVTQLLLRMDNTFKVLPQSLVSALKGSNFYVKESIIKPTGAPPGSQNPPTNPPTHR